VRNNTDTPFGTVTIELLLMDAAGDSLGTHVVTLRDLEPHAIRQFSTWMLPEHPARYRVQSVRGS